MNKIKNSESKQLPKEKLYKKAELRRLIFFLVNFTIASVSTILMADLLWRIGFTVIYGILLVIFFILMWQISLGITHALFGLFLTPKKGKFDHITQTIDYNNVETKLANTAILVPCYNEETKRVYEGIRAIYTSLKATGKLDYFDIFILSDSTDPNKWIAEETLWVKLCQQLNAFGRIYYRRRTNSFHKKAGNIADFCKSWGSQYRYMLCLDADSIMTGDSIVSLVKIMEANKEIGICQTAPVIIRGETLYGRMMQFASNFYGSLFQSGLNYWQQGSGNFWGHNAILRIAPFMEYCSLPRLPGKEPLGGKILSHDFVEAALMRKAGWAVWLAYDIGGSYEENPPNLIENAVRDRRWCQGNFQHTWLVLSKGLPGPNRIHMLNGIMSYLGSLIWLIFLILSTLTVIEAYNADLSVITVSSFADFINMSIAQECFIIFTITMIIILLPKFLSLFRYMLFYRERIKEFGGLFKLFASIILEILLSAIMAPVQMLFHSKFVLSTLSGSAVGWNPQNRDSDDGIKFSAAFKVHYIHTIIGIVWALIAYKYSHTFFWWLSPITFSMCLSIPVSIILSKISVGSFLRRRGLFLIPSETVPNKTLSNFEHAISSDLLTIDNKLLSSKYYGITQAVVDPYINATHSMLLYEHQKKNVDEEIKPHPLAEKLLSEGPESLTTDEIKSILLDPTGMRWLYQQIWLRPSNTLAITWQQILANI
jgi:membrane glycosyltransferase